MCARRPQGAPRQYLKNSNASVHTAERYHHESFLIRSSDEPGDKKRAPRMHASHTRMTDSRVVELTKTDKDRIDQMADADGRAENIVNVVTDSRGGLIGRLTSTSQTRVLDDDSSPADAMSSGPSGVRDDR